MPIVGTPIIPTHDTSETRLLRAIYPDREYCLRCGAPYADVTPCHETMIDTHRSCNPLCTFCWTTLGHPEARIEYYKKLVDFWKDMPGQGEDLEERMPLIQRAVANGG